MWFVLFILPDFLSSLAFLLPLWMCRCSASSVLVRPSSFAFEFVVPWLLLYMFLACLSLLLQFILSCVSAFSVPLLSFLFLQLLILPCFAFFPFVRPASSPCFFIMCCILLCRCFYSCFRYLSCFAMSFSVCTRMWYIECNMCCKHAGRFGRPGNAKAKHARVTLFRHTFAQHVLHIACNDLNSHSFRVVHSAWFVGVLWCVLE